MKHSINRIALMLSGAVFGFLIAAFGFTDGPLVFDPKVNLLDAVDLAVTAVVLFYLQNIISSRGVIERVEKDLIIERLRWVSQKLIYLSEFCQREMISPSDAASRVLITTEIRAVEGALLEVNALLEATPLKAAKDKYSALVRGILKIRVSLTGGSFPRDKLDSKTSRLVALQTTARLRDLHKFIVHVNRL